MSATTPKKRVLILTSSTGSGHDARAHAIRDWIEKLYSDTVDLKIEQLLENASSTGQFGVGFYNFIQRFAPFVHYIYWFIIEIIGQLGRFGIIVGKRYYKELILDFKPQLILSVHDFLNIGYFEYARKLLGSKNVRCVTYCGEFSGGFGYSFNWVNPSADWYISRTSFAEKFALKLGISPEKSSVFLALFPPRVHEDILAENECKAFRSNVLGLKEDCFTVFLTTGGNGANNHIPLLNILYNHKEDLQVVLVCGRNKSAYENVKAWAESHSDFSIYFEGHSNKIRKLIQVSDLVVAKGGGNTAAKALFLGTPIIFNAMNGVMPQEQVTLKFFKQGNATRVFRSKKQFDVIIQSLKGPSQEYRVLYSNFNQLKAKEDPPELFFQKLIQLID